jgi:hypothetical protein
MPESTQIQTQVIKISKKTYNVIRSIVDSSIKPDYEWNKPIKISENKVKFVKYKTLENGVEVKAWEITIEPMGIQKEGSVLNATLISVWDGCNRLVADLIIRNEFTVNETRKTYTLTIIKKPDNIEINADSIHDFEYYIVKPNEEIPYARPVIIAAFVNKLMFFYHKALQVAQNADASEAKQI